MEAPHGGAATRPQTVHGRSAWHPRRRRWSESTQSVTIVDIDAVVRVNATGFALHDPGRNALEDDSFGVGEGNCASLCAQRCCPGAKLLEDYDEEPWNECVAALEREGRSWNVTQYPPERDRGGINLGPAIGDLLRLCHPAVADVDATDDGDDDDARGRDELRLLLSDDAQGIAAGEPGGEPDVEMLPARARPAEPGVFLGLGWRTGALAAGATKCPPPIVDGTRGRGDDWPIPALGATHLGYGRLRRYPSHAAYQLLASLYFCRVGIPQTSRGNAAAGRWIFCGVE